MDIERAISQFRANPGLARVYDQIVQEVEHRIPRLRAQAWPGLSPAGQKILQEHDDPSLTSLLMEGVVGWPGRPTSYKPVSNKFDTYAIKHIQLFVKDQLRKKRPWIPLDEVPEVMAAPDRVPTNTLPMDEIHGVLENPVIQAMDSATGVDPRSKILFAMDYMPDDALSDGALDCLCRQASLSQRDTTRIIELMRERPDGFEEEVRTILGLTQRAANGRLNTAERHLAGPWDKARIASRDELKKLEDPTPDPDRDPFFNE